MSRRTTKGTVQIAAEVSEDLAARFRAFAAGRGESIRQALEMAMTRHLEYPPPPPEKPVVPPLPDAAPVKRGRGRPRRNPAPDS